MDKLALTALRRRVGRMTYEQVRPLFEEARKRRDEGSGEACRCRFRTGENWHYCDEHKAIYEANKGRILQVIGELREHKKNCKVCYVESHWSELEERCESCKELSDIFWVYSHRLNTLRHKERVRLFEQAHGRPHSSKLELAMWEPLAK